ncbi:hypothetical protein HZY97_01615 [Sphingomonas sp. R-74633]|uniref:hypothetical protein n=1 Tax=Sphingomonas sp. R-74633 TaxID=2751188 RepID=UPI0015D1ED04|nr:hypothetical protein [Sphingomonas sp. R-74633]NYT39441.1 hypothetical protein [Sphingomonas sp. R-74633]
MSVHSGFALLIALAGLLSGCLDRSDGCRNDPLSAVDAPDGRLSAVLFQRECGATTGFSTQISILRPGELPAAGGNVFISDDGHGAAMPADWHGPWVDVHWLGPDRLLVRYAARSRIFLRNENVSGVRITYQPANDL